MSVTSRFQSRRCQLCDNPIGSLEQLMQIPVVDPFSTALPEDVAKVVGKIAHATCWANHSLWPLITRSAIDDLRRDFADGEELYSANLAASWVKFPRGASLGVGTIFLPRSAYFFDDLLGVGVKGGAISAEALDVRNVLDFIRSVSNTGATYSQEFFHNEYGLSKIVWSPSGASDRFLLNVSSASGDSCRLMSCISWDDVLLLFRTQ